jgi:hypothetical protein
MKRLVSLILACDSQPTPSGSTGWPDRAVMNAFSARLLMSAVAGIVVGRLLDRLGPRPVITPGSLPGVAALLSVGRCYVDRSGWRETGPVTAHHATSAFAGFRFPREVISVAVRWYLRYGLSYRDVEELLAERRVTVDHVTVYRWVQRFTPEFIKAARPCRHAPGDRWFVDET